MMVLFWGGQIIYPLLFFCTVQLSFKFGNCCGPGRGGLRRRPLKNFALYETVPKVRELSKGGSGPAKEKITRNSPKFENLAVVYNTDIIFKDEEKSGADRIMTKRCKQKLNKLANIVKTEWSNQRLRVIEAWDENNEHEPDSLHYEGRAVDITTSDKNALKYGRLARLAVQAGFDWVKYKEGHVHASVREDSYVDKTYTECFPDDAKVKLENGSSVNMTELKIGDRVETLGTRGQIAFSEILMFLDYNPGLSGVLYYVITTNEPYSRLALTGSHLIFTKDCYSSTSNLTVKYAKRMKVGDCIMITQGSKLVSAKIENIRLERKKGAIAPLTANGNIIVDGVAASCYAKIDNQELAHLAFSPVRFIYSYASGLLDTRSIKQNGLHWYVRLLLQINSFLRVADLI